MFRTFENDIFKVSSDISIVCMRVNAFNQCTCIDHSNISIANKFISSSNCFVKLNKLTTIGLVQLKGPTYMYHSLYIECPAAKSNNSVSCFIYLFI